MFQKELRHMKDDLLSKLIAIQFNAIYFMYLHIAFYMLLQQNKLTTIPLRGFSVYGQMATRTRYCSNCTVSFRLTRPIDSTLSKFLQLIYRPLLEP